MKNTKLIEPKAEKIYTTLSNHNNERIDEYYWLNQRGNKKVIDYLNSENSYRDEYMKDYKKMEEDIFLEIKSRIKEKDSSVPYYDNGYYYYTRYEKDKEYPFHCRKHINNPIEEILLDVSEIAKNHDYFSAVGLSISTNEQLLAYGIDTVSRREYTLYVKLHCNSPEKIPKK